jgi:hypothetical protein
MVDLQNLDLAVVGSSPTSVATKYCSDTRI